MDSNSPGRGSRGGFISNLHEYLSVYDTPFTRTITYNYPQVMQRASGNEHILNLIDQHYMDVLQEEPTGLYRAYISDQRLDIDMAECGRADFRVDVRFKHGVPIRSIEIMRVHGEEEIPLIHGLFPGTNKKKSFGGMAQFESHWAKPTYVDQSRYTWGVIDSREHTVSLDISLSSEGEN